MSGDLFRRAAQQMYEQVDQGISVLPLAVIEAVADWLDEEAETLDRLGIDESASALKLARVYLGEAS